MKLEVQLHEVPAWYYNKTDTLVVFTRPANFRKVLTFERNYNSLTCAVLSTRRHTVRKELIFERKKRKWHRSGLHAHSSVKSRAIHNFVVYQNQWYFNIVYSKHRAWWIPHVSINWLANNRLCHLCTILNFFSLEGGFCGAFDAITAFRSCGIAFKIVVYFMSVSCATRPYPEVGRSTVSGSWSVG